MERLCTRRVLAFDYDGTLAHDGNIPLALQRALEQLCAAGYVLFLVTGRRSDEINLGALQGCFTGIVWENGAVLSLAAGKEIYLLPI